MQVRKYKTVTKQVEETIESYYQCDKCGEKIEGEDMYDAFDFEFELKTGVAYPEGGSGDKWVLDLCPTCAKELVEKLEKEGYKVQELMWDC